MVPDIRARIENDFKYHAPKDADQSALYEEMRSKAKELALHIVDITVSGREQSTALTKLEEVVFWANASLARNEVR